MESFIYQYANWIAAAYLFLFVIVAFIGIYLFVKERKERSKHIKVLSKGKKEPTWYHTECKHCRAELEFSSEHIQQSNVPAESFFDLVIPHLEDSEYIICPLCGKKTGVCYNRIEVCKH